MLPASNIKRAASMDDLLDNQVVSRVSSLDFASRKIFIGRLQGERRSKKRGQSVEFADHRPYVVGDDLRRIDWNLYGRLDRLFLKLFMEEEDLAVHLVLDASASMDCGTPHKFTFVQKAAMTLGYMGLVNLNRVACTVFGGIAAGQSEPQAPGATVSLRDLRGRRRAAELASFLCGVRPGGMSAFGEAAKRIALSRRGKGVMLVCSDFLMKEGYEDGLRLLAGRGYDVFAVQCLSPQELDPDLKGDLRLEDIEDADGAEVTISSPLLKRYRQLLAAYQQQLRDFCARREIGLVSVPTTTAIDVLVLDYLRKRGVVR
ncbi:MAG: DUF58 domain-containing protein [Phycisphaeraceae bacterium]|nr:DUF58 domain-containing protein [Phycisphaeraceae bacterium]MCW5755033.1 DUF58 domain-containing protein [Phycisphaeraceae bacterium]